MLHTGYRARACGRRYRNPWHLPDFTTPRGNPYCMCRLCCTESWHWEDDGVLLYGDKVCDRGRGKRHWQPDRRAQREFKEFNNYVLSMQ